MAKPTSIAMATSNLGNTDFVLEMSSSLKSTGYQAGEKPTHKNFNWWMNQASIWAEDYLDVRLESNLPTLLRSSGTATWNGSDLVLSANLDISFRKLNGEQINRIAATTLSFSDGQVLVLNKDKISASPVTLAAGAYASLDSGEYVIIAESSLTEDNIENECLIFRRSGTNLECLVNGLIYPTGATITFGSAATTAAAFSGVLAAANGGTGQSSYTIGDLLYASGTSALSKLADVATGNVLISGGVGVAPSWGKITSSHVSGSTGSGNNFALQASPVFITPSINNPANTFSYNFTGSAIVANRSIILPLLTASDTFVFQAFTQTLTNKTISGGTISGTIAGSPTLSGSWTFSDEISLPNVDPPTANLANRNSFVKAWGAAGVGAVSTGAVTGYNITSISVSSWVSTITWDTNFTSTSYIATTGIGETGSATDGEYYIVNTDLLAGSAEFTAYSNFVGTPISDIHSYSVIAMGDQ